jgi:hypothetical protein
MIKIIIKPNPLENYEDVKLLQYNPQFTVFDYLTGKHQKTSDMLDDLDKTNQLFDNDIIKVLLNKQYMSSDAVRTTTLKDGDELLITFSPKPVIVPFLISLAISLVMTGISIGLQYLLMDKPKPPVLENKAELPESATYNWDGPATSYAMGRPIPLIYGKHGTGGTLINALTEGIPYGIEGGWRLLTDESVGYRGLAIKDYVEGPQGFWATRSIPQHAFSMDLYSATPKEEHWLRFFNMIPGGLDKPTRNGFFISHIHDSPFPHGRDIVTQTLYPNGPQEKPIFATSFKLKGFYSWMSTNQNNWNSMYAWKRWRRYLTYDFTADPSTKRARILVPGGNHQIPTAQNWDLGWFMDASFPSLFELYLEADEDFILQTGIGEESPPHFDETPIKFEILEAGQEEHDLYNIPIGTRIYSEIWYEGFFVSNSKWFLDHQGQWYICHDASCATIFHGLPQIKLAQVYSFGSDLGSKKEETKFYSTANGLRMTVALSDGEICSVGRAQIPVADDYEGPPQYREYSSIFFNDIPIEKLYAIPTVEGYGTPIDIDATKGGVYPQIKNAPRDYSNTNLLTKRITNTASFDFLIGNPSILEGQKLTYTTVTICSSIEISLMFKQGMYEYNAQTGDFSDVTVNIFISYYPEGSDSEESLRYWTQNGEEKERLPFTYNNKKTTPHAITIKMGTSYQPIPVGKYTIVIEREDTPQQGGKVWDAFWIQKISEFNFDFLRYPNTAIMGMRILPSDVLQGTPPKLNTVVEGRFLKVPIARTNGKLVPIERCYTVLNETTEEYEWKYMHSALSVEVSQTETMYQYTSNPAFVVYDLLTTQELYPFITEDTLVWTDFLYAAEFCWEMVGKQTLSGSQERRFKCNIVIDGSVDAATLLNQLCAIYRFKLTWVGNKLRLLVLKEESPVQRFTDADIIADSYNETYNNMNKIPNTLDISYYDENNKYKQEVIQVTRKDSEAEKGKIVKQGYSLLGTTTATQAKRISNYLLASLENNIKIITFKTSLRGLVCIPGNVIRIETESIPYVHSGYIRINGTTTNIYLDSPITIPSSNYGTYSVEIQSSVSGTVYTTGTNVLPTISIASGSNHTFDCIGANICCSCGVAHELSEPLSNAPITLDTWQIIPVSGSTTYSHDYRVEEIKTDLDSNQCSLVCSPHNPTVYTEDPFWYTRIYIPPVIDPEKFPIDVENLTLTQLDNQNEVIVNVTYNIPTSDYNQTFKNTISSVTELIPCDHQRDITSGYQGYCNLGCTSDYLIPPCPYGQTTCGTCSYTPTASGQQVQSYNLEFESSITTKSIANTAYRVTGSNGVYKGQLNITPKRDKLFTNIVLASKVAENDKSGYAQFTLSEGDIITQNTKSKHVAVDRVDIYLSYNGQDYQLHGTDTSRGVGYLINLSSTSIGKRIWVKAQAVSKTGIRSLNPPTATLVIGGTWCLDPPAHLSICGQDDSVRYFSGCDIDICWTKVSAYKGAGRGIEEEAGETQAGAGTDHSIVGYYVMVFESNFSVFLQNYDVTTEHFSLSHQANIDLHAESSTLLSQYGQRALQFRVYQVDNSGNESCEPAELSIENLAPSMSGYTPEIIGGTGYIIVDWSSFVNDSTLYASDIEGYQIWYGTSMSNLTSVKIPDPSIYTYRINGLDADQYFIYIVPMDCFGTGSPINSYRSEIVQVDVRGLLVGPFPPPDPEGFTGSLEILAVTTGASYTIQVDGLESFGFDNTVQTEGEYQALDYNQDYIYYNTDRDINGYCYVTASNLNSSKLVKSIIYSPAVTGWLINFDPPVTPSLTTRGYTDEDGKPVVGQKCSINCWAQLDYEAGGGSIFGGGDGVNVLAHVRWRHPNPDDTTIARLNNFEFDCFDDQNHHSRSYNKAVSHEDDYYGTYYSESIGGIKNSEEIDVHCAITSTTGDRSTYPILANNIQVNTDILSLADQIFDIEWDAVTNEEGRDLQVVIQDWEDHWQDGRILRFEVYAAIGYWNFSTSTWTNPHPTFPDILDQQTYTLGSYKEDEYNDGNSRLRTTVSGSIYHCFVGATDGPIFHWVNSASDSTDGGPCTYWDQPSDSCTVVMGNGSACSGFELGNCPYGQATTDDGTAIPCCTYASDPSFDAGRSVNGVSYNYYHVALGLRLTTGELKFVQDSNSGNYIQTTTLELIDSMHIKNAAITTAKIQDAAINNAKIRNLSAGKVWIGDYAANEGWKPYTQHCAYDLGDRCGAPGYETWTEDNAQAAVPIGAYKTGLCPRGEVSGNGITTCSYTESLFALERIFAIYGQAPDDIPNNDFTYINGGMILTNTIRARSLQIGALNYVVDLDIIRTRSVSEDPMGYVQVKWFKPAHPGETGRVAFPGKSGQSFNVNDGEYTFFASAGELPTGTSGDTRKTYIGYIEDYVELPDPANMVFAEVDDSDVETWFTNYKSNGRLPLCAVVIVNNAASGYQDLGKVVDPEDVINSDVGQGLRCQIIMCTSNSGTYITNNDITTGIIHNEIYTSVLDLRHYTGYISDANYVGHGRLIIDAPSVVYPRDTVDSYGDLLGKDWWSYMTAYPNSYGTDTKLLIGRPYVDGLESEYVGLNKDQVRNMCDTGYLWFYRTYDDTVGNEGWKGNLEIGGCLRLRLEEEDFELLAGKKYISDSEREYHPTINIYDIGKAFTDPGFRIATLGRDTLEFPGGGGAVLRNVTGYLDSGYGYGPLAAQSNATLVIDKESGIFEIHQDYADDYDYSALIIPPNHSVDIMDYYTTGSVGLSIQGRTGNDQAKIHSGIMINTRARYGIRIASDYVNESPDIGVYISNAVSGAVGVQIDPPPHGMGGDYVQLRLGASQLAGLAPNVSFASTGDIVSTDSDLWWCAGNNDNWRRLAGKDYGGPVVACQFDDGSYSKVITAAYNVRGSYSGTCLGAKQGYSIPIISNWGQGWQVNGFDSVTVTYTYSFPSDNNISISIGNVGGVMDALITWPLQFMVLTFNYLEDMGIENPFPYT